MQEKNTLTEEDRGMTASGERKKIYIMYPEKIGIVSPEIYGHFTEHIGGVIYDGIWVGKDSDIPNENGFRKDIVEKLRAIKAPVIRWPGGCFAEAYDWRDGIGKNRPTRINWWQRDDGKTESNEVGTHEFMDFCEAVGAKAYFAANLTSVTPLHIRNWMDYCLSPQGTTTLAKEREANGHPEPFDIPFWGVGNENWGGGGDMLPEHYVNEFRRFSALMKNAFPKAELFMCGENAEDYRWTDSVIRGTCGVVTSVDGFAMHFYCGSTPGEVTGFGREDWDRQLSQAAKMGDIINRNRHIIAGHGMEGHANLVVDEWGCWHRGGTGPSKGEFLFEQQNTLRDAAVAALTLNIFNNNCDIVRMANIAQLVNCLQSLFLSCGENCIVTPTYHVFDMYKEHMGAEAVRTVIEGNEELSSSVSVSASVKDGKTLLTLCNLSYTDDAEITLCGVGGFPALPSSAEARLLSDSDLTAHNTFENPDRVKVTKRVIDPSKPFTVPKGGILSVSF